MNANAIGRGRRCAIDLIWPKLDGLERLRSIPTRAFSVPPYIAFTATDFAADPERILLDIRSANLGPTLVVRSCAALEDATPNEPPGFFDSVLNVESDDASAMQKAIEKVCASYHRRPGPAALPHKIIVQSQLLHPTVSGVCRVGDLETDFLEVDYDDSLLRTDAVTAGLRAQRLYLSPCLAELPKTWGALRRSVDILRHHFVRPFFIEFAIDGHGVPVIFQVRSDRRPRGLATGRSPTCAELEGMAAFVETVGPLSVMADWNPAEMLGRDPEALDISLYDELMMSGAWAEGRTSMGWRAPTKKQLMVEVGGRPFIRLPLSFESLLPKGLSKPLARALVRDRLQLLEREPQLHDKVEFRVMWSAFAFDETSTRTELIERGICAGDVERLFAALKRVTRNTLRTAHAHLRADRVRKGALQRARRRISEIDEGHSPAYVANELRRALEICRKQGTVPFSRQARIAFTFRYIINHLVSTASVDAESVRRWEAGLNTVTRHLSRDLGRVAAGTLPRSTFNRRYGHLRPRTYSLESLRYDERQITATSARTESPHRAHRPTEIPRLGEIFHAIGLDMHQSEFWQRAAEAFRAREDFKFAFTALLSDILVVLGRVAAWSGMDRAEFRRLRINEVLTLLSSRNEWRGFTSGARQLVATRSTPLKWPLGDVLLDALDLHVVRELEPRPTFVGGGSTQGPIHVVTGEADHDEGLRGAIVAIESPDPGFDWIFAQPIAGLITAYGGEFSHMGVRCAEFGVPAAIGCGKKLFDEVIAAKHITLNAPLGELWSNNHRLFPT